MDKTSRLSETSPPERMAQAREVIARLRREYPHAKIVLNFGNPWEL
ncbi:MAG: hypothetical protein H5T84_11120, partial [Thermoleophilia bacterium]|nr:hypothetical protein [Thermoleophilia bacterium]